MSRRAVKRLLLATIGVLYAFSIPWYRDGGEAAGIVGGLPSWVAVALGCYVAVAFLNSAAWLLTDVPDVHSDEVGEP